MMNCARTFNYALKTQTSQTASNGKENGSTILRGLFGTSAESAPAVEAYASLQESFDRTSFSNLERHIVLLTTSHFGHSVYCVRNQVEEAKKQGVPNGVIELILKARPLPIYKLEVLHRLARSVVETRGKVPKSELRKFLEAGYTHRHINELVLGVAMNTMSSYLAHLSNTPVDAGVETRIRTDGNTKGSR